MATISHRTFRNYALKLERENLRARHSSLSYGSIMRAAQIKEVRDGGNTILVADDWREQMKAAANLRDEAPGSAVK